jgi:hypothetical protein
MRNYRGGENGAFVGDMPTASRDIRDEGRLEPILEDAASNEGSRLTIDVHWTEHELINERDDHSDRTPQER